MWRIAGRGGSNNTVYLPAQTKSTVLGFLKSLLISQKVDNLVCVCVFLFFVCSWECSMQRRKWTSSLSHSPLSSPPKTHKITGEVAVSAISAAAPQQQCLPLLFVYIGH